MMWVVGRFHSKSEDVGRYALLPDRLQQMARSAVKDSKFDLMPLIAHQREHIADQFLGTAGAQGGYDV
ncbi:MAG: hypothetical protein K2F88_07615 [Duncaniella sp.]|nr:hypothetical protein [Duncaniella sp.]